MKYPDADVDLSTTNSVTMADADDASLCETLEHLRVFVTPASEIGYQFEPVTDLDDITIGDSGSETESDRSSEASQDDVIPRYDILSSTDDMGYPDPTSDTTVPKW